MEQLPIGFWRSFLTKARFTKRMIKYKFALLVNDLFYKEANDIIDRAGMRKVPALFTTFRTGMGFMFSWSEQETKKVYPNFFEGSIQKDW